MPTDPIAVEWTAADRVVAQSQPLGSHAAADISVERAVEVALRSAAATRHQRAAGDVILTQAVVALKTHGWTVRKIADALDISPSNVQGRTKTQTARLDDEAADLVARAWSTEGGDSQ